MGFSGWLVLAAALGGCGDSEDSGGAGGGAGSGGSAGAAGASGSSGSGGSAGASGSAGAAGSAGSAGSSGGCPLDADARALVEDLMLKTFFDADYVAFESHTSPKRIALALSLPATTNGHLASFTPIETCTAASGTSWYAASCTPDDPGAPEFWQKNTTCSRWGCDAAGATLAEVWFSVLPQTALEPRHPFTYALEAFDGPLAGRIGTVEWTQNPYLLWKRTDDPSGSTLASADGDHSLKVTLDGGSPIDLSHTSHLEISKAADGSLNWQLITIAFSALAGSDAIAGDMKVADPVTHTVEGSLTRNGTEQLATVEHPSGGMPRLSWQGSCAP